MKCSLGISNFLEEISSLFPFCCFPLFLCIDRWGRLSYLLLVFFGIMHSDAYIFPFILCFSLPFFSHISHDGKLMVNILPVRIHQYENWELPDVQDGFRKGRGTRDQNANICWIMEKAREFQKNIYFCFIGYAKAFDSVYQKKLWKILQVMGIANHLICLLRNLYAGQETVVRTGHGATCQGPAPADPGYSKERRLGDLFKC